MYLKLFINFISIHLANKSNKKYRFPVPIRFFFYGIFSLLFLIIYFLPFYVLFNNDDFTLCLHKRILGFECPGCGMTRAVYMFLHFNFNEAMKLNFAVLTLFSFFIAHGFYLVFNNKYFRKIRLFFLYLFTASLIIIYCLRIVDNYCLI